MIDPIFYVYKIFNTLSKKCYIGWTSQTPELRWITHQKHYYNAPSTQKFYNAMKKYDLNVWQLETIAMCFDVDTAKQVEMLYIEIYDSYRKGYNSTKGGDGISGFLHSNVTKEIIAKTSLDMWRRLSESDRLKRLSGLELGRGRPKTAEVKKKISETLTGFKHSNITKSKMSIQKKGSNNPFFEKQHSDTTKAKIRANHPFSKKVQINNIWYDSINHAAISLGVSWNTAKKLAKNA
jgi:group I intron endonuclease